MQKGEAGRFLIGRTKEDPSSKSRLKTPPRNKAEEGRIRKLPRTGRERCGGYYTVNLFESRAKTLLGILAGSAVSLRKP